MHMWNIGKLSDFFLTESAIAEQADSLLSLVSLLLEWSVADG